MKTLTFRGGIHPQYHKEISLKEPLKEAPLAKLFIVPLSQHIGAPSTQIVNKGDYVEEGQVLGKSTAFISSIVHSPVFGKVVDIKKAPHPALGPREAVFIERDDAKPAKKYEKRNEVEQFSPRELIEKIKNAGIVGMGGAAFPTHVKCSVPEGKRIETLIVNGAECEPYLTCDHLLMTKKTREILKGIEIISKILNPNEIFITIENNKKDAFFAFQKELKNFTTKTVNKVKLILLKTKYPQGGEKQLIKASTGKEVPPGGLPLDIGFLVQNVGTIYAVYEAVYLDKPLIERIVTLSGDCLKKTGNYMIRIGTTLRDVMENCGIGFCNEPKKIIFGGPMMGFAQTQMESPILKNTSGVLFFSGKQTEELVEGQCIKCAKCVDVCPVNLVPTDIMKNVKKGRYDALAGLHIKDCMECGSCSYICPARIPLIHYIKEGKTGSL
ncbi:MAG: electron transport complex subunit RsxC [Candidatus Omnitrophota bacterium]